MILDQDDGPNSRFYSFKSAEKRREKEGIEPLDKPAGPPNCLNGLTIVFTGELETMSREESTEMAKQLGA